MQTRSARYGARSCVECRRRKIRCTWPSGNGKTIERAGNEAVCDHCMSRGLYCMTQRVRPSASAMRSSTRERIGNLEQEVSLLNSLVRANPKNIEQESRILHAEILDSDDHYESDLSTVDVASPAHLRLLFDNLAAPEPKGKSSTANVINPPGPKYSKGLARGKMQALLPSKETVLQLSNYASGWITLYHDLFPSFFVCRSSDELVSKYEKMRGLDVPCVTLAMYILSLAITAQQPISDDIERRLNAGRGRQSFVNAVYSTVERHCIYKDALAANVEGLETIMLAVRLCLGRGNLRSAWVIMRRAVCLAELIGLPRVGQEVSQLANSTTTNNQQVDIQDSLQMKAAVWEAICATDRNFSMMLNLPPATAAYCFPLQLPSNERKGTLTWRYNYQLSNVCHMIFKIDESYVLNASEAESYENILRADRLLRELASGPPKTWWELQQHAPLAEKLVKFWHHYLTARVHMRPAMADVQYTYSQMTCREGCLEAMRRFPDIRPLLPSGFFVCRVVDVQAFTAATYLLLSEKSLRPGNNSIPNTLELVSQAVASWRSVSDREGSDFAREAIDAIELLQRLTLNEHVNSSGSFTLQIPLLGKIHIKLSSAEAGTPTTSISTVQAGSAQSLQNDVGDIYNSAPTGLASALQDTQIPMTWFFEFDDKFPLMSSTMLTDDWTPLDVWYDNDVALTNT